MLGSEDLQLRLWSTSETHQTENPEGINLQIFGFIY
jgi:hypothetical protein